MIGVVIVMLGMVLGVPIGLVDPVAGVSVVVACGVVGVVAAWVDLS